MLMAHSTSTSPTAPAGQELTWRDGDMPYSTAFDDHFYCQTDGRLECGHVFLAGNGLPARWVRPGTFRIGELGFGTGLNACETWRQWKATRPDGAHLHFVSFELYPMRAEELSRALTRWPEIDAEREALVAHWPEHPAGEVDIALDEIFITSGAKEDTANFQELFAGDIKIAIPDPVYPVYVDSNVMAGRSGKFVDGRYEKFIYMDTRAENGFTPDIPKEPVDLIYLCFPNNPTGQVATKEQLKRWVEYAEKNKAVILYDAAYEAFIRDPEIPHSIFEIDGAKQVAAEFRSLSKTAGFTGTRCGYTIIPKEAEAYDADGKPVSLNALWNRRQNTKFNGVAYPIQKGAYEVFTAKGRAECNTIIDYYLENARIIGDGLKALGISYSGGTNSPYIWLKTPGNLTSWEFFDKLLFGIQVVGTPGSGFGKCGEGYFRLTSFGKKEEVIEAVERIKSLKL